MLGPRYGLVVKLLNLETSQIFKQKTMGSSTTMVMIIHVYFFLYSFSVIYLFVCLFSRCNLKEAIPFSLFFHPFFINEFIRFIINHLSVTIYLQQKNIERSH